MDLKWNGVRGKGIIALANALKVLTWVLGYMGGGGGGVHAELLVNCVMVGINAPFIINVFLFPQKRGWLKSVQKSK